MSQWELSELVLPLPSRVVKNSWHCFPGWTWLQMSGEPDSYSARAPLAGRPLLAGLLLAGWKNMNGYSYSSLAWKFLKRNENGWPRLPPSSKPWDSSRWDWLGKVDKLQKELKAKSLALTFEDCYYLWSDGGWILFRKWAKRCEVGFKKREKKGGGVPRNYFFKGPACIFIMEDFASVCVWGGWGNLLTKAEKRNLGGKQQDVWEPTRLVLMDTCVCKPERDFCR